MHMDLRGQPQPVVYKLLTGLVVPRPIAWVTSMDMAGGLNLAPFSFFNLVASDPPIVVIGIGDGPDGKPKHTARNIAAMREFVVNLVTEELMEPMNISAADFPPGRNELEAAGLHAENSNLVKVPRVAEARASLECELHSIQRIGGNNLVIAQVVGVHVAEGIVDEQLRVRHFTPIGRMGTPSWYTRTADQFELARVRYADLAKDGDGDGGV